MNIQLDDLKKPLNTHNAEPSAIVQPNYSDLLPHELKPNEENYLSLFQDWKERFEKVYPSNENGGMGVEEKKHINNSNDTLLLKLLRKGKFQAMLNLRSQIVI